MVIGGEATTLRLLRAAARARRGASIIDQWGMPRSDRRPPYHRSPTEAAAPARAGVSMGRCSHRRMEASSTCTNEAQALARMKTVGPPRSPATRPRARGRLMPYQWRCAPGWRRRRTPGDLQRPPRPGARQPARLRHRVSGRPRDRGYWRRSDGRDHGADHPSTHRVDRVEVQKDRPIVMVERHWIIACEGGVVDDRQGGGVDLAGGA